MSSRVEAPFPFIVGRNRSGTTLLRAMFDSHPEMAVPHESHLIVPVLKNRRRYETQTGVDIDLFERDARMTWSQRWGCPEGELRTVLATAEPATVQDCLRVMFGAYAVRQGKARYGEDPRQRVAPLVPCSAVSGSAVHPHRSRRPRRCHVVARVAPRFVDRPVGDRLEAVRRGRQARCRGFGNRPVPGDLL